MNVSKNQTNRIPEPIHHNIEDYFPYRFPLVFSTSSLQAQRSAHFLQRSVARSVICYGKQARLIMRVVGADALERSEAARAMIIKLKVFRLVCNQPHGPLEHTLDSLDLFLVSFLTG